MTLQTVSASESQTPNNKDGKFPKTSFHAKPHDNTSRKTTLHRRKTVFSPYPTPTWSSPSTLASRSASLSSGAPMPTNCLTQHLREQTQKLSWSSRTNTYNYLHLSPREGPPFTDSASTRGSRSGWLRTRRWLCGMLTLVVWTLMLISMGRTLSMWM